MSSLKAEAYDYFVICANSQLNVVTSVCICFQFFTFLVLLITAEVLAGVWSFLYIDEVGDQTYVFISMASP